MPMDLSRPSAFPPASPLPTARATTFTVLTVNLHMGFDFFNKRFILHALRDAVRTVSADMVFLQEVLGEHELHASRVVGWPEVPHYEFLAETLWKEFAYGRNAVYPQGHHGNALLSKFPILSQENRDVSVVGPERRGLLYCVLRLPDGRDLHTVCVHLGLREAHRRHQVDLLRRLVDDVPRDTPLLVAGDFNDWRLSAHRQLRACQGLDEVFVQARGRAARTFPARLPLFQLDRVYVRGAISHRPIDLPRRPWSHLSDHVPLAAEVCV
jgi:endonuclease/exonuclease/phosphatase family metal-dependent hydrolase